MSGRIRNRALPAREQKRQLVLEWIAGHFQPSRRHGECEVNGLLAIYDDVASGVLERGPSVLIGWPVALT